LTKKSHNAIPKGEEKMGIKNKKKHAKNNQKIPKSQNNPKRMIPERVKKVPGLYLPQQPFSEVFPPSD
jgi:hypothetical protein